MDRIIKFLFFTFLFFTFSSCKHESDLHPAAFQVEATIRISDVEYWPKNDEVVFEFYQADNKFSLYEMVVNKPETNMLTIKIQVQKNELSGYEIKLSIRESAVKKIVLIDYGTVKLIENTILPDKQLEIVTFGRLQKTLFVSCTICHGEAQNVAAGLYLLPDSSYSHLVNITAVNSSMKRVEPYEPDNSFILKVMNKEIDFEHTASSNVTSAKKELLRNWILKGATNDK